MKRIIFYKSILLSIILMAGIIGGYAQTPINGGFETAISDESLGVDAPGDPGGGTGVVSNVSTAICVYAQNGNIVVSDSGTSLKKVSVYNIQGQQIITVGASSSSSLVIPVKVKGTYLVKLESSEKVELCKVLVK